MGTVRTIQAGLSALPQPQQIFLVLVQDLIVVIVPEDWGWWGGERVTFLCSINSPPPHTYCPPYIIQSESRSFTTPAHPLGIG